MTSRRYVWLSLLVVPCAAALSASGEAVAASTTAIRIGVAPRPPSGVRVTGRLSDTTRIQLTVTLNPRDPSALAAYAVAVSTPGSSVYRNYLSVAQFTDRFGPTPQEVSAVESSLRDHGLTVGSVTSNRLAIQVNATAGRLAQAFSTSFKSYSLPGGRTAFANTAAPSFDLPVARFVQGVIGLDTLASPHPIGLRRSASQGAAVGTPHVVTGGPQPCPAASAAAANLPITYTADQIAAAYRFSSLYSAGDLGAGQTIALYELEPFTPGDIAAYQACYGTGTSVSNVSVDGGPTGTGQGEAVLDIENLIGLVPAANILVYSGPNGASDTPGSGPYDTFAAIINDNRAKVVSTSWGICEAQEGISAAQGENTLFQQAAVQGQSIVASSGDNGAEDCTDSNGKPAGGPAVDDPASQPFITGVGGTSLNSIGPPPNETAWNENAKNPPAGSGGGGISAFWPMPPYQSGAPASLNVINPSSSGAPCGSTVTPCREVPDVSAAADPYTGYLIYFGGQWIGLGGTSASAPTWAALLALANASRGCGGVQVGFANPALYRAAAAAYPFNFNDVVLGDNNYTGAGGFSAGPGYDMATGLGTPSGANFAAALCDRASVSTPAAQTSAVGASVAVQVVATSSAGLPLRFSATGLPAGLSISPTTGLISGRPSTVGRSVVVVGVSDADGALGTTSFQWSVVAASVKLNSPGNQTAVVGRSVRLQLVATTNNGEAPTYMGSRLPPGLSVNSRTGNISGAPHAVGRFTVTVRAALTSGTSSSTRFRWTVGGLPSPSKPSLSGLATGAPSLSVALEAGKDAPSINSVEIGLPRGLSFVAGAVRSGHGINLTGAVGSHLKFSASVVHGALRLILRSAARRLQLSISAAAIQVAPSLSAQVTSGKVKVLQMALTTVDALRETVRQMVQVSTS